MIPDKNPDPNLIKNLRQYFETKPRPGFLPALKSDLMDQAAAKTSLPHHQKSRKTALILASALTALVLILFITPVRDAIGQVFVELFQTAESDAIPHPPAQTLIAGTATAEYQATTAPDQVVINPDYEATISPDSVFTAEMILFQVERSAGYDILEPAYLPEGFELTSASFDWGTRIVHLVYDRDGENSLIIDQEPVTGMESCDLCTEIGPDTAISAVQIGDLVGEYVKGGWKENNGNSYWTSDPDMQTLRWQSEEMVFDLNYQGDPDQITQSDLVEIAENLVNRIPDPGSQEVATLSVEEVEQAAGFDVLVPSKVPSIFKFSGGSYLPDENMTFLFYDLMGRRTNGLRIAQEPITETDDCDLCSEIGPAANIQSVQIGDVPGELVNGVWMLEDGYKKWRNEPWVVRLRWQKNDTVFEISFFGPPMTMTKSSMVHLAESMASSNAPLAGFNVTPTAPAPETTQIPDPAKLENANMTIEAVEQAAGFDVLEPAYLANQEFYGANFDAYTKIVYLFYQDGMTIRQERYTDMTDCELCAEVRYSAIFRYVQIGDIEAEFLFDANMLKQLHWQVDNIFYDLSYDHDPSELELDDLIQIAESFQ